MPTRTVGQNDRGLRLLSIDGGGIRGLSALLILKEILYRIQRIHSLPEIPRPCDVFDLAGGTNTGGLIVIMLFRLRMSIEDAIKAYTDLAKRVFSEKKWLHQQGAFKATLLEDAILCIIEFQLNVERNEANGVPMLDEEGPKCFVCATHAQNMALPTLFRAWKPPDNPTFNCTIVEAARATSANPTLFKAIEIGEENLKEKFVDGGLRYNNPVRYVLQEAQSSFPNRPMSCIISLGTGTANVIGLETPDTFQKLLPTKLLRVLRSMAEDCENTSEELANQSPNMRQIYFRLNVDHGLQNVSLAEWDKLGDVKTHTMQYLQKYDVSQKVGRLIEVLNIHTDEPPTAHLISPTTELTDSERLAFDKLEKVIATSAYHDSQANSTLLGCLPGTREEQIERIMEWSEMPDSDNRKPFFVVLGPAGSGKSSLLWTIAQFCKGNGSYAASFFFSSADPKRNNSARLVNTIVYQFTEAIPQLRPYVARALKAEPSILSRSMRVQLDTLLLRPFSEFQSDHPIFAGCFHHCVVVIDALDECGDDRVQLQVIEALTAALSSPSFPLLCILSSRFDVHIENAFSCEPAQPLVHDRLALGQGEAAEKQDIFTYLNKSTMNIRNNHPFRPRIPQDWPDESDLELIVERSGGQFIYATTVIRYIESPLHKPHERLQHILSLPNSRPGTNPFTVLDDLYRALMLSAENRETVMEILGIELVSSSPHFWTPITLRFSNFFENHFKSLDADMLLAPLASVLRYEDCEVTFYHLLFAEFLLDSTRSKEFFVEPMKWQMWMISHLVQRFYEDKGILLDDVHYMIEQARPGTELHQAINAGFELVIDHPNSLPSESVYNIWPFVAWRFFWELQFCISIKKIATVFLHRGENCLPLPVLIKLIPAHKPRNSFILFELCCTIADLEKSGFIKNEFLDWEPVLSDFLLWTTYLADYFDDQRRSGCNILLPEDYLSATLRCLWYLQTPRRDICSSLEEELRSLKYLPAKFGIPSYLRDTSKSMTRDALKVLLSLLPQSPPSVGLLSSLKLPFGDEVVSKHPSSSRRARNAVHEYLMRHDADYQ